jgi:hypothetical protein
VRRATVGVVEGVMSVPEMVLENYSWEKLVLENHGWAGA